MCRCNEPAPQQGFLKGLLSAALQGAVSGAIGAIGSGREGASNDEGPVTKPSGPPGLKLPGGGIEYPSELPGHSTGGWAAAGETAWVGEHGPELAHFNAPTYITPNHLIDAAVKGSEAGGDIVNNHFNFHVNSSTGKIDKQSQEQLTRQMLSALERTRRRS